MKNNALNFNIRWYNVFTVMFKKYLFPNFKKCKSL